MSDLNTTRPRLRHNIDAQPIDYEGARYLLLRDPLMLTDQNVLVPQPMVPALQLMDGTRSVGALRGALLLRLGLRITSDRVEEFVQALDDALLLDNPRYHAAFEDARAAFRGTPARPAASAGAAYPADPAELSAYLQGFLERAGEPAGRMNGAVRGLVSPHIDYERGGPVYAQVWREAAEAARAADLAIIFGTDHYSEGYPISLTRQNYATPFGILPTDTDLIDGLARIAGEETAYAGELHHRREHSIELAAVWLHHIRGGAPVRLAPILVGPTDALIGTGLVDALVEEMRRHMRGRRTVVIAAGDLAHVGPAFDTEPVTPTSLAALNDADDGLIRAMCSGSAEAFYRQIRQVNDANNVCGVTPIYLTLRLLAPLSGEQHGYAVCPADERSTSVVTVCGVTFQ